jgi:agmatinase
MEKWMNYPLDAQVTPRFAGPTSFYRLPVQTSPTELQVAITGIPFDSAASFRPGARFGPRSIREMSSLLRPFNRVLNVDPYRILNVADVGDCPVNPFNTMETLDLITRRIAEIIHAGAIPLSFGGDHLVSLGILRGLAQVYGPVPVLQIDAHLDTWDSYFGSKYTHGSWMRRAVEEGLVDTARTLQVAIRGPLFSSEDISDVRRLGIEILPMDAIVDWSVERISEAIRTHVGTGPLYITFDIDGVDPAFAPGTGVPEIGGLTSIQAVTLLDRLAGLRILGADVVEVAPPFDSSGITALLAARAGFEILGLLACQRGEQETRP